jgi:hypothetical protein
MLTMTHHAQTRLQQRGIPPTVVENLLDFGHETHSHHRSLIVYFDRRARQQLRRQIGMESYKRIEPYLDAYAVVADSGEIITVGHRTRRINRH